MAVTQARTFGVVAMVGMHALAWASGETNRGAPLYPLGPEYRTGDSAISIFLRRSTDGRWSSSLTGDLRDQSTELVRVHKSSWSYSIPAGNPSPNPNLCRTKMSDRADFGYLTCNSVFYRANVGSSSATTLIRGVLSLGILTVTDAASGNTGFTVSFDQEAFDKAVVESGAVQLAKDTIRYRDYRTAFEKANSSKQWQGFIAKYKDSYDPDSLVGAAEERLAEAIEREVAAARAVYRSDFLDATSSIVKLQTFIEKYAENDPDNLVPQAREKLKAAQKAVADAAADAAERERNIEAENARQAARESERLQKELVQWRAKVKAGDDTFCGPVIEVKRPMIRIALRVQLAGYGNDAWLKVAEVYPPEYGCQNVNGRLSRM